MGFGTILILIGIILAIVDLFVDLGGRGMARGRLTTVAVILVGVGVLVGGGGDLTADERAFSAVRSAIGLT